MTGSAATQLLNALDVVLNSNSLLLDHRLDEDVPDTRGLLAAWLPSPRFRELLHQADIERGWQTYGGEAGAAAPIDARLVVEGAAPTVAELEESAFREDLVGLLTTPRSPHRKQLARAAAELLVDAFLAELAREPGAASAADGWRYFRVAPDFLRSSGYAGGPRPARVVGDEPPTYFDGGPFDRCLVMRRGPLLHVLLTNGAP
jgi:hypothetical protein